MLDPEVNLGGVPDKRLELLLSHLAASRFEIGVRERLAAQKLATKLTLGTDLTLDDDRARAMFSSLLARSEEEVERLKMLWPQYFIPMVAPPHSPEQSSQPANAVSRPELPRPKTLARHFFKKLYEMYETHFFRFWFIFANALFLGGAFLQWVRPAGDAALPSPKVEPAVVVVTEQSTGDLSWQWDASFSGLMPIVAFGIGFIIVSIVIVAIYKKWLQNTGDRPRGPLDDSSLRALNARLDNALQIVNNNFLLQKVSQALEQRHIEPTRRIDAEATTLATARAGGLFSPIYLNARRSAEYLVLIETQGAGDAQASKFRHIVDRLAEAGTNLERYYFINDPRYCFAEFGSEQITLEAMASSRSACRLIILGEGRGLINPVSLEPHPWTRFLRQWDCRTILTPLPLENWGRHEFMLARELDLPLGRATSDGLIDLVRLMGQDGHHEDSQPFRTAIGYAARPTTLAMRAEVARLTSSVDVTDGEWSRWRTELNAQLGAIGYRWLSALAIYPVLQWDLTVFLGVQLKDGNQIFYSDSRAAALAQLPWFRLGRMPNWLRQRLIKELSPSERFAAILAFRRLVGDVEPVVTSESGTTLALPVSYAHLRDAENFDPSFLQRDVVFHKEITRRNVRESLSDIGHSIRASLIKFFARFWWSDFSGGAIQLPSKPPITAGDYGDRYSGSEPLVRESRTDDLAIALVHGIGNTDRLQMIAEVCASLRHARPGLALERGIEVHEVHESKAHNGGLATEEPSEQVTATRVVSNADIRYNVIRNGRFPGGTFRIGVAHWADLTYYRRGFINLIGALMMTAFGARFFAEVAASADRSDNWSIRASSWVQQRILKVMVQFLALVILPVTIVSLIFSCIALMGVYSFVGDVSGWRKGLIASSGLVLCSTVASSGIRRSWKRRKECPLAFWMFFMIAVCGLVFGLAMLVGDNVWISVGSPPDFRVSWQSMNGQPQSEAYLQLPMFIRETLVFGATKFQYVELADRFRLVDDTAAYFALMHAVQLIASIVLLLLTLLATINLALLALLSLVSGHVFRTYVFATVSVITIWLISWVLFLPENLATIGVMTQFLDDTRLKDSVTVTGINWSTWKMETLRIGLADEVQFRAGFMNNRLYADTYPVMWFEIVLLIFFVATFIWLLTVPLQQTMNRLLHMRTPLSAFAPEPSQAVPRHAHFWPRLFIPSAYVSLVLVLLFVLSGLVILYLSGAIGFSSQSWMGWANGFLPLELVVGSEWARVVIIGLFVNTLFLSHLVRDGAKQVLDVVNHFTPGRRGGMHEFPVRQRIERRFDEMIAALLSRGDKPNLLIIAHGQGAVVTLDALMRRKWIERLLTRVEGLTLVTFGSPVTNVYQRYFPQLYLPFDKTWLRELSRDNRVKWLNVYRVDDFVGTYIENSIPNFPFNIPVVAGGHTNYWSADVMAEVFKHPAAHDILAIHSSRAEVDSPIAF